MSQLAASDYQLQAQSALAASGVVALRDLIVEDVFDTLEIRGKVTSYYLKQLAQEFVRAATGGQVEVVNSVRVV